ncbi:MAG: aspartyl/asparaginyl beta-hydroxylase domain-containing protein [Saprospiraceae bacterium]|nr:aspartyl/asparaginyl beta-hydroxylase domain-containing protein [Saprospiraceae bacterium]
MDNRFFKLNFRFDPERMQADLATCEARQWTDHFNKKDYVGDWTGIALRSASGKTGDLSAHVNQEFEDTPLLNSCPYFREILDQLLFEKETVRLLALAPGSVIHEHRDHGLGYTHGCFRLHIPIITDEKVLFTVGGMQMHMDVGECWYANFDLPHSIRHEGTVRRVHLVIDGKRNAWTDAVFQEAGYDFEAEKKAKMVDPETAAEMITHLQLIDSDAARAIIEELKASLQQTPAAPQQEEANDWMPAGLQQTEDGLFCRWMYFDGKSFTEPFFDGTLNQIKRLPANNRKDPSCSSIPFMIAEGQKADGLAPTAFVFHVSRCGSTLLAQMLSTDKQHIVLSEVPLLDALLRLPHRNPDFRQAMAEDAYAAAIRLMGRKRTGAERYLFVKTDSWHVFFYPEIRRLFPETPIILLYRDPGEVLRSQRKLRGIQSFPSNLEPGITGIANDAFAAHDFDGYFAALLERIMARFADIARTDPRAVLVNYQEGPMGMVRKLEKATGIRFAENIMDAMDRRRLFHAKRPFEPFEREKDNLPEPELLAEVYRRYEALELLNVRD